MSNLWKFWKIFCRRSTNKEPHINQDLNFMNLKHSRFAPIRIPCREFKSLDARTKVEIPERLAGMRLMLFSIRFAPRCNLPKKSCLTPPPYILFNKPCARPAWKVFINNCLGTCIMVHICNGGFLGGQGGAIAPPVFNIRITEIN